MSNSTSSTANDPWAGFEMWYYNPSIPGACIYAIVFTILTGYHTFRLIQRRTYFCIPFVIGGVFEFLGYIFRALAHNHTQAVPQYAIQSMLLLLAPILFAASIYMVLGRLIRNLHGEKYSVVRVTRLTKIFVGSDIVCFMVQLAGDGLLVSAKTKSQLNMYNSIILAGLCLQILVFCLFIASALIFQVRMQKAPTEAAETGPLGGLRWKRLMMCLYGASVMITVRNVFRAIEYALGYGNYLSRNEWTLYVFDGLLMIVVLTISTTWYISELSVRKRKGKQYADLEMESAQIGVQNAASTWK